MPEKPFTDEQIAEIQRAADDAAYAAQSRFMHKEQISEEVPLDGEALIWDEDRGKFVPSVPTVVGVEDHNHDGSPIQKLEEANTHEARTADAHHAETHSHGATVTHTNITGVTANQHHNQLHDHDATGYISFGGQSLTTFEP